MADIAKRVKRLLREYAEKAHEAELREALKPIAEAFKHWERGASFDLSDLIHKFHQGPARELYVRYATRHASTAVAYAIVNGLVDRATVPAELLEHLAKSIKFYEEERDESLRSFGTLASAD